MLLISSSQFEQHPKHSTHKKVKSTFHNIVSSQYALKSNPLHQSWLNECCFRSKKRIFASNNRAWGLFLAFYRQGCPPLIWDIDTSSPYWLPDATWRPNKATSWPSQLSQIEHRFLTSDPSQPNFHQIAQGFRKAHLGWEQGLGCLLGIIVRWLGTSRKGNIKVVSITLHHMSPPRLVLHS